MRRSTCFSTRTDPVLTGWAPVAILLYDRDYQILVGIGFSKWGTIIGSHWSSPGKTPVKEPAPVC
jgi:hypothetical protein